jgi:glycerol-3-phosphate cytidylyltransferase-like family protein
MSARILTPGHIKTLEFLCKKDFVVIGLLTAKAMKGYKEELVPFQDRKYILQMLDISPFMVVPQDTLDPTENIQKYNCDTIASGDGWEDCEFEAIKRLGLEVINIKLPGEKRKKYSSSKIIKKLNEHK